MCLYCVYSYNKHIYEYINVYIHTICVQDDYDEERLNDVYERLAQIDADTAEARASAVLAGM